jgi:hypothetical protein
MTESDKIKINTNTSNKELDCALDFGSPDGAAPHSAHLRHGPQKQNYSSWEYDDS